MNDFDDRAKTWDENPIHMKRSIAIAAKMEEMIPIHNGMRALEFGAGTGILSFLFRDKLGTIIMMDSSAGMVEVMKEKVAFQKAENFVPLCYNLEIQMYNDYFDLIYNQMVLHHISDVPSLFKKFYRMILPHGFLAIADLYSEDGTFHGEGFDGHNGFDPEKLKGLLLKAGFKSVDYQQCYTMDKKTSEGSNKSFPIFLLVASK
jgi:ubiquinone/menaquinone biosynthesis C-methylase UbiE